MDIEISAQLSAESRAALIMSASRRMDAVVSLVFSHNNIHSLGQIDALRVFLPQMQELRIENNPVLELACFRLYAIQRLPELRTLNGATIGDDERQMATSCFATLDNLLSRRVVTMALSPSRRERRGGEGERESGQG